MVRDYRRMILERQRHAVLGRPPRTLEESFTAPGPCRCFTGFVLGDTPDALRNIVPAPVLTERDPGPGAEHPQHRRTEIRSHANELLHIRELRLTMLRDRAGEIVVRRDGIDRHAGIVRAEPQLAAARRRQIERVAMRPLAVDLHALVAVLSRAIDDLLQRQGGAAVPDAQIRDAVEADFHFVLPSARDCEPLRRELTVKPLMMTDIAHTGGSLPGGGPGDGVADAKRAGRARRLRGSQREEAVRSITPHAARTSASPARHGGPAAPTRGPRRLRASARR